jgi:hypothetical protein
MSKGISRLAARRIAALPVALLALACGGDGESTEGAGATQAADSAAASADASGSGIVPSLSPATAAVGAQVTLTASGLPGGATIEIGFGAPMENYEVLTQAPADAQGNLSSVVTVPSWAEAGRVYHFVIAQVNQPPLGLSRPFPVAAP